MQSEPDWWMSRMLLFFLSIHNAYCLSTALEIEAARLSHIWQSYLYSPRLKGKVKFTAFLSRVNMHVDKTMPPWDFEWVLDFASKTYFFASKSHGYWPLHVGVILFQCVGMYPLTPIFLAFPY